MKLDLPPLPTLPPLVSSRTPLPAVTIAWARDLPALPAAVLDLMALLGKEDVDPAELAAKMSVDMALTAKTLRLANSAFYGLRREVTSVTDATAMLGLKMVKGIVTAAALSGSFKPPQCAGFDFKAFWRHGVATAVAAQMLAFSVDGDSQAAFTAGLLCNIGKIVLAGQFPERYAEVLAYCAATGAQPITIERDLLGLDHAFVGARVAEHWRFPPAIVTAIGDGADPLPLAVQATPTLGHIVAAADRLVSALESGTDPAGAGPGSVQAAWSAVGVPAAFWAEAASEAFRQTEAICAGLLA